MSLAVSVLDFGVKNTIALIAEKKEDGSFSLLGGGEAKARGLKDGQIVHLGDATESVVEALRKAEKASGVKTDTLYFNFDDPAIESVRVQGSKHLSGEGQIDAETVTLARRAAERLINDFEKTIVYAKEIGFVIDDRDAVLNPVGVFGQKLDILMQVLLARASLVDLWKSVIRRAGLSKGVAVPSILSSLYGILPREDRQRKRLVLDLGTDFLNVCVFSHATIQDYQIAVTPDATAAAIGEQALQMAKVFFQKHPDAEQVLLTGDYAENELFSRLFKESFLVPVFVPTPLGVTQLAQPRLASAAGLLFVADEMEVKKPLFEGRRGIMNQAKSKAASFIQEYF